MPLKAIYLAKRNPGLSREGFTRRWRQHFELAKGLPPIIGALSRYTQCDVLPAPAELIGINDGYDGVVKAWVRELGDRLEMKARPEYLRMVADELETFDQRVDHFDTLTQEHILCNSSAGEYTLFRFISRRPETTPEQFSQYWRNVYGPLLLRLVSETAGALIYIQNHVIRELVSERSTLARFDGIEELSFDSLDGLTRSLEALQRSHILLQNEERFIDLASRLSVITRENRLLE